MSKTSQAKLDAVKRYTAKLDEVRFRAPKGYKDRLVNHAKSRNESLKAFLMRAAETQIKLDNEEK